MFSMIWIKSVKSARGHSLSLYPPALVTLILEACLLLWVAGLGQGEVGLTSKLGREG